MDFEFPNTFIEGFHIEEDVKKMPYEDFTDTGLKISKISLGCGAFGGILTYGDYDQKNATATLTNAIRSGINFIDGGPHYGKGLAETFLGSALKEIPRNAYYISTKVGRCGNQFDFSPKGVKMSFEQSLKRLNLDKVDIVFVHDIEFASSQDLILNETLPAVESLVKAGKVKFIGISGYPISTLWEVVEKSSVQIKCVLTYCRDTLFDCSLQDFLPKFQSKNVAVINAGCIGMRLLSNCGPPAWHPASQQLKDICHSAAVHCRNNDVELGKLALHHSLKQPGSCTCLVGVNDPEILQSNLNLLRYGLNEKENLVLQYIEEKYFSKNMRSHWEGIEIELFRKAQECESVRTAEFGGVSVPVP
ncbi:uncharacterized protein LOC135843846 [Planococcus citri]|uniref:uncharacterized protein LOC135843846 n=1 Tax=Planococcus citri TaxID=170843 RepID=UPI0031F81E0D